MKIKGGLGLWSVVLAAGLAFFGDVQGGVAGSGVAGSDVVGKSGVTADGDVAGSVIAGRSGGVASGGVASGSAINNSRIRVKFTFGGAAWAAADGATAKSNTAKSSAADGNGQAAEMAAEAAEPETFDYKTVSSKLAEIEAEIRQDNFTRQTLDDASAFLAQQDTKLDQFIHDIEKNSKYAEESLAALGEAPAEGMSEDPAMAEMRSKYTALVNNYKSRMSEANLLKVEISRISSIIAEARSRIIIGNLVAEQNVIIQAAVPCNAEDSTDDLMNRIHVLEHRIYPQALQWLAEGRVSVQGRHVHIAGADRELAKQPENCLVWPPLEKGF